MEWSHNDTWLLSADHSGSVKYWQSNMNNVKTLQAHNDPVRGVGYVVPSLKKIIYLLTSKTLYFCKMKACERQKGKCIRFIEKSISFVWVQRKSEAILAAKVPGVPKKVQVFEKLWYLDFWIDLSESNST